MFTPLNRYRTFAPLILRIVIGIIFLVHGLEKFGLFGGPGLGNVSTFFGSIGIPIAPLMAFVVAVVETLGGLALILGLGTRIASILLSIIMLVAIFAAKLPQGTGLTGPGGFDIDLALLAGLLALLLLGSGPAALEQRLLGPRYV